MGIVSKTREEKHEQKEDKQNPNGKTSHRCRSSSNHITNNDHNCHYEEDGWKKKTVSYWNGKRKDTIVNTSLKIGHHSLHNKWDITVVYSVRGGI